MGWLGRDMASEWRGPEMERPWLALPMVLDRFMAEGGCGMPELRSRPPKVCAKGQHGCRVSWQSARDGVSHLSWFSDTPVVIFVLRHGRKPV
jgi:hypothetical protein